MDSIKIERTQCRSLVGFLRYYEINNPLGIVVEPAGELLFSNVVVIQMSTNANRSCFVDAGPSLLPPLYVSGKTCTSTTRLIRYSAVERQEHD